MITSMGMITFDTTCVPEGGVPLPVPVPEPEPEPVVVVVEKDNTALKIGIVVAVLVILIAVICLLICCLRRKFHKREHAKTFSQSENRKVGLTPVNSSLPDESDLEIAQKKKLIGDDSERHILNVDLSDEKPQPPLPQGVQINQS